MSIERRKKGEISPDVYNRAYSELVGLSRKVPRNGSIELEEIIDGRHPLLSKIANEFPLSKVIDLGGQPVLNIVMK